ncbi:MAG: arsenate reductase ArsC [Flavobacteriaceae bacterium]|jgi:arsenate reductase
MKKVLVLCTGNSCRSQIAHGWLNYYSGGTAQIYSAGIETHGVNPKAIATMAAVGVDISHHTSNLVEEYGAIDFDYILTVCDHAAENCPVIPSKNAVRLHQNFSDPSKLEGTPEQIETAFAETRDTIAAYCKDFVKNNLGQ